MEPLRNDSLVKVDNVDVISSGTVIEYFPGALGLTIGRLLHLNAFSVISLAKILTFIVFLVICYCTIKLTPIAKEVFLIVSLLPMSLYQGTGVTYDGMTYSLGIFTIALILRLWQTGLGKKGWGALYISVFLLGNCKGGVYLTIILLLFIVPKEHFPQKKILMCFTIFLLAFITILIRYLPVYSTYMPKESNAIKTEEIMQSDEGYQKILADELYNVFLKFIQVSRGGRGFTSLVFGMGQLSEEGIAKKIAEQISVIAFKAPRLLHMEKEFTLLREAALRAYRQEYPNREHFLNKY